MLVSVVMAVFNGEEFLQEAIDSILSQTYSPIELIIVNDASTDGTNQILRKITDERVEVIQLEDNKGAAAALNFGIDKAQGEWIAIHDADDISYPNRIEDQVNYLNKHPNLVAVGSFIECIQGSKNLMPKRRLNILERFTNRVQTSEEIKSELYSCCPLTHGTIIFSKKVFFAAGKYNPNLKISYDFELWTRLITLGSIEKVPKKLYKYRIHNNSLTNKHLIQLIKEAFFCTSKYIRNTCYKDMHKRPVMVIFGPEKDAKYFALQAKKNIKAAKVVCNIEKPYLSRIISLVRQKKLDGVIILSNYKFNRSTIKYLTRNGLVLNKNLFQFQVWYKKIPENI